MYTYTHIHMYTYTHIHIYTYTHIHIYTYTHIHISTYTRIHISTYTHIHIHTYTHIHIHTNTHTHIRIQLLSSLAAALNTSPPPAPAEACEHQTLSPQTRNAGGLAGGAHAGSGGRGRGKERAQAGGREREKYAAVSGLISPVAPPRHRHDSIQGMRVRVWARAPLSRSCFSPVVRKDA